jgi:hypothetical protein
MAIQQGGTCERANPAGAGGAAPATTRDRHWVFPVAIEQRVSANPMPSIAPAHRSSNQSHKSHSRADESGLLSVGPTAHRAGPTHKVTRDPRPDVASNPLVRVVSVLRRTLQPLPSHIAAHRTRSALDPRTRLRIPPRAVRQNRGYLARLNFLAVLCARACRIPRLRCRR